MSCCEGALSEELTMFSIGSTWLTQTQTVALPLEINLTMLLSCLSLTLERARLQARFVQRLRQWQTGWLSSLASDHWPPLEQSWLGKSVPCDPSSSTVLIACQPARQWTVALLGACCFLASCCWHCFWLLPRHSHIPLLIEQTNLQFNCNLINICPHRHKLPTRTHVG